MPVIADAINPRLEPRSQSGVVDAHRENTVLGAPHSTLELAAVGLPLKSNMRRVDLKP
ncbi:MAG TPA: hypothetical protein VH279_04220 [Solirubrobacteraceae bacterium]|jgi:hypothetical protein|nr:hypothetical protein [Solirubrobacteraceae bacterium]